MAHVPMGDVQELWNDTPGHNWSALHKTLEQHLGKAEGIDNALVQYMLKWSQEEEHSHAKYPDNPQEFYDMVNKYVKSLP